MNLGSSLGSVGTRCPRGADDATYHGAEYPVLGAGVVDDARPRPVRHRRVEDAGERLPHVAVQRVAHEHQPPVPAQLQGLRAAQPSLVDRETSVRVAMARAEHNTDEWSMRR